MQKCMEWQALNFDWNHLRSFLAVAEEGSFSAAAKVLATTQPTLSRQIAAFEKHLGVQLFERLGQGLALTPNGLALMTHAEAMREAALKFSFAAQGHNQRLEGTVVVSVGELDAIYRMPQVIAQLQQAQPGIKLEVVVSNQASDLKRREADIAVRYFQPTQPDLIIKKLGMSPVGLFGHGDYVKTLATSPDTASPAPNVIGFERSSVATDVLKNWGWTQVSEQSFTVLSTFQPLQLALCKESLGLVFFPIALAYREPWLQQAFVARGPVLDLPMWLVCHQELRTSARVRYVFDVMAEVFATP